MNRLKVNHEISRILRYSVKDGTLCVQARKILKKYAHVTKDDLVNIQTDNLNKNNPEADVALLILCETALKLLEAKEGTIEYRIIRSGFCELTIERFAFKLNFSSRTKLSDAERHKNDNRISQIIEAHTDNQ